MAESSLPSPQWRKFGGDDPDSADNANAYASLREELDQQRTRAEAAEAEVREVRSEMKERMERVRVIAQKWTHGSLFDLFMEAVK